MNFLESGKEKTGRFSETSIFTDGKVEFANLNDGDSHPIAQIGSLYIWLESSKIAQQGRIKNMEQVKWDSLVIEINDYLEADETLDAALRQVVELHLQVGQENPNEREAAQNALKALLKGRDGTPFRRGQKSSVPASVRVAIDRICGVVNEANLAYYNHDGIISALSFKHTKSGGGLYEDADEFASAQTKKMRNKLSAMYRDGSWDGSVNSLLSSETTEE